MSQYMYTCPPSTPAGETEAVPQSQGSTSAHPQHPSLWQGLPDPLEGQCVEDEEQQRQVGPWEDPGVLGGREELAGPIPEEWTRTSLQRGPLGSVLRRRVTGRGCQGHSRP